MTCSSGGARSTHGSWDHPLRLCLSGGLPLVHSRTRSPRSIRQLLPPSICVPVDSWLSQSVCLGPRRRYLRDSCDPPWPHLLLHPVFDLRGGFSWSLSRRVKVHKQVPNTGNHEYRLKPPFTRQGYIYPFV